MRKIICLLLLIIACAVTPAVAQTMTDDQIVTYVMQEVEKGTPKANIIRTLVQRGVTREQLQRVQRKMEAEQQQIGAVDLTGGQRSKSDQRTRRQRAVKQRTKNGQLIRSVDEEEQLRSRTHQQRIDDMEDDAMFFDLDSLDYYASQISKDQQVFGRNIFNQENLTFEPNMNMATPTNYRLGAGDVVIIDVWGASQQTFNETISPDGTVTLEGVGPVHLAGMTVGDASSRLRSQLSQYYSDCQVSLSLGETRSIIVQVLGEVNTPGSYTISGLSTAFNALYAAGGISDVGTLRSIKVYRSGRNIATIDVYDYLLNGNSASDVSLQDNDVIIVGPYDCLVEIRGKVKRPMFYEMKSTESVGQLLDFAGGFTGDAYRNNIRLIRKAGEEYSIHTIDEFGLNGFTLTDGDSLFVDSVVPRFSNRVSVMGAVMHPGDYQLGGDIQTVRDLLRVSDGLTEDAFIERAVMHREKEDLSLEMIPVDVQGIMAGTTADVALRKNDRLYIPNKTEMRGEQTLRINGEVNYPGTYVFAENTTIKDLILQAGGLTRAASTARIDVFRRLYTPDAESATKDLSQIFSFNLANGFIIEDTAFVLQPYDEVQVRRSPVFNEQQNVKITGFVNFPGEYALTDREFHISQLVQMAGGLAPLAYSKGARLIRTMTDDERQRREASLRNAQISLYEQSMESERGFNLDRADTLLDMKMNLGNTYSVSIDLEKAMAEPGGVYDIVLRANDVLDIPQYSNFVKVSGEVMYPISIPYKKGASLGYYIRRAGGYTTKAGKKQTYTIYMNGSVAQLGRRDGGSHISPGSEIVVPTKPKREGLSTAEIMILGTSTVSISSMIISLINNLK
ncbi:MAG: SLBB domain-containing protein [Bacteroidaceae bacterium]|nr:SLBB domain-containing protein [Bacteroidaceae bacterium]